MNKRLLHKDVFMPGIIIKAVNSLINNFKSYYFSKHLKDRLADTNKDRSHNYLESSILKTLNNIKESAKDIFEVELTEINNKWYVTKYCFRADLNNKEDIVIAIRPQLDNGHYIYNDLIVTAWINSRDDSHQTLDFSKYDTEL